MSGHGYEHMDAEWENTVGGDARYYVYYRKHGEEEQNLFQKAGTRREANRECKEAKRQYPTTVMACVLDRKKGEVTYELTWEKYLTLEEASTRQILHELASRYERRGKEEKTAIVQDLLYE